ncbi:MAG TPA: serine/threonine-protein kinase [Bryobacteraceae bacterium]
MNPTLHPDGQRWRRLETLFYQASDMDVRDRAQFLDQVCAGDTVMRRDVESLLGAADHTLSALREPAEKAAREIAGDWAFTGRRIGPWRILAALGEGGMGRVYLASRADEVYEQKVAIKLMRADFGGDRDMLLRFRTERQILAKLNHSNIARLLDGGVSVEGLPYLVMEYVEGVPIDRYCAGQRLSIDARLRLFRTVCGAVEYAHHNLVIHRDIKPANILVTEGGEPKLLDFGIARLLDPEFSGTARTQPSERLMTPEYASPEQVRGESVTTAADVYALGVLLYELLAGVRPFRLKTESPLEIARAICEQTPQPPSAASENADAKRLRGDLDRIVMMAMRKEPERRYGSVEQLSADVEAYLGGYPLQARTDTWGYRSSTFVRRHKAGVAAALLFAVALTGFGIGMGVLAKRASRQREIAEREKQFLSGMFQSAAPEVARGETITARTLLDRGAQRIDGELVGEPQVRGSLLETIAHAYRTLGMFDQAEPLAVKSVELDRKAFGGRDPETVKAEELLAELYRDKGQYGLAESLLTKVLDVKRATLGDTSPEVAGVMGELGECYYWEAKDDQAISLLRRTLAIDRKNGPDYGVSERNYLALTLERKGDFDEARQLLTEAVDINRRVEGTNSPDYAISLHNLGSALIDRGDLFGAEAKLREALAIRRVVLGPEHPDTTVSMNNLGYVLLERGEWREAEPLLKSALDINRKDLGPRNPRLAGSINNWARVLQAKGDYAGAEVNYNRALDLLKQTGASATWPAAQIIANLGVLDFDQGNYPAAEQYARQAMGLRLRLGGDGTPAFASSLIEVGNDLAVQRNAAAAEPLYRKALDIRKKKLWPGHPSIMSAEVRLGEALVAEHKAAEAEPLLRSAADYELHEPFRIPAWQTAEAKNAYGECLKALGQIREGEALVNESRAVLRTDPRPAFRPQ